MGRKGVTYEEKQKLSGVERSGSDCPDPYGGSRSTVKRTACSILQADGYVLDTAKQDDDTLEVVTDQFVEVPGIPILWEPSA